VRSVVVLGCVLLAFGSSASSAQAALAPEVEAEFQRIVEFNYRGSAQASPPQCGPVCQDLRAAETRPGGWSTPEMQQLNREARTLRVATGLSKAIRLIGGVTLGATAFVVGYLIGGGVNAKFFRVGLPAKSPVLTAAPQRLSFFDTCSPTNPCPIGSQYHDRPTITKPAYVWQWNANGNSPYGANWWDWRSTDADCNHPAPPTDAPHVFESVASSSTCIASPTDQTGTTTTAWWYQDDLKATTPLLDYNGQPSNYQDWWPPTDPGLPTTTTRTRNELESPRYPLLNQKIEFELGVPEACDPIEPEICNQRQTSQQNHERCNLSTPDGSDPNPNVSTDQYAPAQYAVVTPFTRTTTTGGEAATALKVGWTRSSSTKGWIGWGWRHVAAKHGWTQADISATQVALQNFVGIDGGLIYRGPENVRNGAICQRKVVVAPEKSDDALEPSPKEIITSHEEYLREAP
jgi:hypothetical protein